jgi:hypothetical protein
MNPGAALVNLSPEAWTVVGTGVVTCGSVAVAYLKTKSVQLAAAVKVRDEVQIAAIKASGQVEEVRKLAAPTGNGFADATISSLARIEAVNGRISDRLGHVENALLAHLGDHTRVHLDPTPARKG